VETSERNVSRTIKPTLERTAAKNFRYSILKLGKKTKIFG